MSRTSKYRLSSLEIVHRELIPIKFGELPCPDVPDGSPPTLELLDWVTRLYCFSILSHFRELLKSLIVLSKSGYVPAAFIITRCLYEIGAHAYYVQKHVKQYRKANNAKEGWKFMESINMGSLYMKEKRPPSKEPFPQPRNIGKIIRSFREWPSGKRKVDAYEDYSYLSEFNHPNMAAFSHYYKLEPNHERRTFIATLVDPPRGENAMPLAEVTFAVAATLVNLQDLLNTLCLSGHPKPANEGHLKTGQR